MSTDHWLQWGVLAANAAARALGLRQLGRGERPARRARPRLGRPGPAGHRTERPPGRRHFWRATSRRRASLGVRGGRRQGGDRDPDAPRTATCCSPPTRGGPTEAAPLFAATAGDALARGEGLGVQIADWATAILHIGLGHYPEALARGGAGGRGRTSAPFTGAGAPRADRGRRPKRETDRARPSAAAAVGVTAVEGSDWAAGLEARSRALLSEGERGRALLRRGGRAARSHALRPELARAHLLYGEWLRRESRRVDARHQLRTRLRRCSPRWAPRRSPSAHAESCWPPARRSASGRSTRSTSSRRRRSTSPGWPATGAPTPRSAPSCSSAPAPSNGTSARCSTSWASPRAGTSREALPG